jgi:putative ABC transport system ATP-binding protein
MDLKTIIKIENLSRIYQMGKVELRALDGISLTVNEGEFVAIMGPSGSGKSTLMNIIGCLDQASSGGYFLEGEDISQKNSRELVKIRRKKVGFIFQTFNLLPRLSARDNIELPMIYAGIGLKEKKGRIETALKAVNLENRAGHKAVELSGGERQRVAIARAVINQPSIILADEPTGNLDSKSGQEIMLLLERLNRAGSTILMVTHDRDLASHARRIIELKDGRVVN